MHFNSNKGGNSNLVNIEKLIEGTFPIIKGRTRFFIVKSFDHDSI